MSYGVTNSELIAAQLADAADVQRIWGGLMYNVVNHGIVGDGITNNTSALQALINEAIAAGRRTIFFPHGVYFVESLVNADQVDFVGDNSTFVGGYAGEIANLGSDAALKAETVTGIFNVKGYGAKGDGVADDTAAIQSAIAAMNGIGAILYFPNGIYKISSPITLSLTGMKMVGESLNNTYLVGTVPTGIDLVRIAASHCEVTGFNFRPDYKTDICIRVYAGLAYIHNNRFLAAVNNQGKAIILTDTSPVDGSFIAGAYTHTIFQNYFGASGYAFFQSIEMAGTSVGQNANVVMRNVFIGDYCVTINSGGATQVCFNLMQSSTGTYAAPVGIGVDCVASSSDVISYNYFERFSQGTLMRADAFKIHAIYNHYDHCTEKFRSLSSLDYTFIDPENNTSIEYGWRIVNALNDRILSNGGTQIQKIGKNYVENRQDVSTYQNISVTANDTVITPITSFHRLDGSGAARTGCSLSTAGAKSGQRLTLFSLTWPVTLIPSTTAKFAGAATSVVLGNTAGNVMMLELIYSSDEAKWIEISRSIV